MTKKNTKVKKSVEPEKYYTIVYMCGPECYYYRSIHNDSEVLFTYTPDDQRMFGGIKTGTTTIRTDHYPSYEETRKAFLRRYKATEDGIYSMLYGTCAVENKKTTIDIEVRELLAAVGNINHHHLIVEKSTEKKNSNIIKNYSWNYYDNTGHHNVNGAPCKIGTEFLYNISLKDIKTTLEILNSITNNIMFSSDVCEHYLSQTSISIICDKIREKLKNETDKKSNQYQNYIDDNNVLDDYRFIIDRFKNAPLDSQCVTLTDQNVLKQMTQFITQDDKKCLSIAIIAKTPSDVYNICDYVRQNCDIECVFTLICTYPDRQTNLFLTKSKLQSIIYIDAYEKYQKIWNMKFDYIIQNPPYNGSMHMNFFNWGYRMQRKNNGKMIIIQPATYYIDIRPTSPKPVDFKNKLEQDKAVASIIIENYNYDFATNLYATHAITFIDFTRKYNEIDFRCYGHRQKIKSIVNESNPYGNLQIINSIISKMNYSLRIDTVKKHSFYTDKVNKLHFGEDIVFTKYAVIIGGSGGGFGASYGAETHNSVFNSRGRFDCKFGNFATGYLAPNYHPTDNGIFNEITFNNKTNGSTADNKASNIYGTRTEIENWIENSRNNPLMLFINIIYSWDQHNHTNDIMPWLVDKVYSDKEIFDICQFTQKEREFIIKTIMLYRSTSAYYQRYILGTNIDNINKIKNTKDSNPLLSMYDKIHLITDAEVNECVEQCKQEAIKYVKRNC